MATRHKRNAAKHEYEIEMAVGERCGGMVFAGNRESTAVQRANEVLAEHLEATCVRLYHSYPSPGPMRRYVGIVKRDGLLHRSS